MTATRAGSPVLRWGREKVVELFGADLRSLAVFRMALAILVLADLAFRAVDLTAHYADDGVLPRSVLLQGGDLDRWAFSLNLMSGETFFQALLFGVGALAALAMLVGYRTRLASVVVWVLVLSIQWRNPLVVFEGDTLLRMLLFWGMFLPLGAYWSVDGALKTAPSARLSTRFLSFATVGLFLQIALVYWFSAILKSGPNWRVDGAAIYYALSVDEWATPVGTYLYQFPTLLTVLTFATILFEAFGPFLLFFPIFTGPVRTVAVLAFMSFQFGIRLTMDLGLFSWISAFCMVCFLPSWFWDKVVAKLRAAFPEPPRATVHHLQRAAAGLLYTSTSILTGVGQRPTAGVTAIGDEPESHAAHAARADTETTRRDKSGSELVMLRSSLVVNLLAAFFLLYIIWWNLAGSSLAAMPERVVPLGSALGLEQGWGVFAPNGPSYDNWYVISGTLSSGQQIDLMPAAIRNDFSLREGASWEKPEDVRSIYKNKYWRKYMSSIREEGRDDLRSQFGRYICQEWNARHEGAERLVDLQLGTVEETTLPDYRRGTPERTVLLEHGCS